MRESDHPDGLRYFFVYCGAEAISDMSFHLSGFRCTLPCFEETLQKKRAEVWKGGDSAAFPVFPVVGFSPCRMSEYRSFLIRADRDLERLVPCEAVVSSE